ncbi:hypothetical protein FHL15_009622 [Xylaria flabelliformis]|uniref:ABC transporter n=1 Tax=Xylaria flabelliformis TaxID=2512241 RepID=A0A553HNB6_9PEZI|nr:hypothetical protein FHL15_009622 [Xylaria flabelliformis]
MDSTQIFSCRDGSIGPVVESGCRGGFDFTGAGPSDLADSDLLTGFPPPSYRFVPATNSSQEEQLICRQTVQWAQIESRSSISIASTTLSLASGISLALLSHLEHARSIRPSFIITFYLTLTVLLDIARVRTQWLLKNTDGVAATLTASLIVKAVLLVLEAIEKRHLLLGSNPKYPPESTSGPFSRGFFLWLNSLLVSGFGKVLCLADLPSISEKLESKILARDLSATWDKYNRKGRHALALATVMTFRLSQPFLIQEAVNFVQNAEATDSNNTGYGLIGGFALVYIGLAVALGWSSHLTYRLMTMIRGALISIVYRKILGSQAANSNDSAAVTLMGTDVQRIAETFHYLLVETIPAFIQLGIATYLLYLQLGAVFVVLLILSIAGTLLSGQIADKVSKTQKIWLEAIQARINFTSEILGSMKSVKMLGLTGQMFSMIQALRDDEISKSKRYRRVQAYYISIVNVPEIVARLLLFGAYAIVAHINGTDTLSVSQAISSLALIFLVSKPLADILVAIPQGWSALGCFQRIQAFLNDTPDQEPLSNGEDGTELRPVRSDTQGSDIVIENVSFGWSRSSQNLVSEANVRINPSETGLTILTGPVGCGKSTFLKGILRETPYFKGHLDIFCSRVAFCDQTPWIISGSLRANIVAESEYDELWYRSVIRACALDIDISRLSHGDSTVVGSKGVKLSGGQKQRISLARAVYSRKPIAILDDVLSGLDPATEEAVFRGVFGSNGLFKKTGTAVILATHSGKGCAAPFSSVPAHDSLVKRLAEADLILAMNESGKIVEQGKFSDLNVPGRYVHSLKINVQSVTGVDDAIQSEKESITKAEDISTEIQGQDSSRQTGDWATYKYYAAALSRSKLLVFIAFVTLNEAANGVQSVWLNWWAQSNERGDPPRLGYWLGIFAAFSVAEIVGLVTSIGYLYVDITPNAGKHLHDSILNSALSAPMSFLSKTETGVLVNSQDLRLADMTLPSAITNVAFQLGQCIVATVLAATAVGYFAAVLPFVIFVLYLIQRFYLRTSRQLRLLELETSAPLFSQFIESLNGLVTIRAFGWTESYTNKTNRLLDQSQKPFYLLLCIQRWLVLVLDLVVAGLAIILVGLAVALRSKINPGLLGIALVQLTSLSHALTALVQFWTLLETSLGAIARIKDFSETTPREALAEELSDAPSTWPNHGAVTFESVSARYEEDGPLILKDLSFSLKGGQKIGIVGRTGSGKSSTVQAILGMIDITKGRILVDDVDLASFTGAAVREHITTLTQDPFLFPASIRSNIDPLGTSTDEEISATLEKVKLWNILQDRTEGDSSNMKAVLDTSMDGELLSHGQRQLFCLARALLKPGKILILDEPTSSVDPNTDAQMQTIIRDEFQDHTVIMIAHRLLSLMDFDFILVLDQGAVVESGSPTELLGNSSSRFAAMCDELTGGKNAYD